MINIHIKTDLYRKQCKTLIKQNKQTSILLGSNKIFQGIYVHKYLLFCLKPTVQYNIWVSDGVRSDKTISLSTCLFHSGCPKCQINWYQFEIQQLYKAILIYLPVNLDSSYFCYYSKGKCLTFLTCSCILDGSGAKILLKRLLQN